MILSKTFHAAQSEIEVQMNYDIKNNSVGEMYAVYAIGSGSMVDITDVIVKYFSVEIERMINDTNWSEVYREQLEASLIEE
jgi:hypothetical protein